jgi:hypothetical protein
MKVRLTLILFVFLALITTGQVRAQDATGAQRLDDLRAQLQELEYKEAEIKIRLEQLEFDLRPENIERQTNGYGSTRPEELREARRRQLQIEKDHLLTQWERLASDRVQLSAAIANAQASAYHQSAQSRAVLLPDANRRAKFLSTARVLIGGFVLVLALGPLVFWLAVRRRSI